MDPVIVSAMAAVLGSLAGGSATVAAALVTQRAQGRRELMQAEIHRRQALYGEFLGECSKRLVDAYSHTLEEPQKLVTAYELLNRIRLSASDAVLAEAEGVVRRITDQYFLPNLSIDEMHALVKAERADPLRSFGEACRAELKAMQGAV
jgi:hypothetical protein